MAEALVVDGRRGTAGASRLQRNGQLRSPDVTTRLKLLAEAPIERHLVPQSSARRMAEATESPPR